MSRTPEMLWRPTLRTEGEEGGLSSEMHSGTAIRRPPDTHEGIPTGEQLRNILWRTCKNAPVEASVVWEGTGRRPHEVNCVTLVLHIQADGCERCTLRTIQLAEELKPGVLSWICNDVKHQAAARKAPWGLRLGCRAFLCTHFQDRGHCPDHEPR